MAVAQTQEDYSSLIPALHLLCTLGFTYLTPTEALARRGGRTSRVVLEDVLAAQLCKLNQITFRGQTYAFHESNIDKAVQAVSRLPFESLLHTNEKLYDLLTLGRSFEQTIDGYTRSYSVRYIDWDHPRNNVFHVCDEFVVERHASPQTRRPDIVLFVNGIPLVVIECKRPDRRHALAEGISQHLRNQRLDEIPGLYAYSQLLLVIAQNQAKYATTDTPEKFWSVWKEDDPQPQDAALRPLVNRPLHPTAQIKIFSERSASQRRVMERLWQAGDRLPSPQDRALHSLCRPERLLELIYRYIVFDNNVKKICRYQQYFSVQSTLARVTQVRGDASRPGGVIWHTTGSGKSLTMVMLAKALALEPSIANPKLILVTDRVDLDDQIYKTFLACQKQVANATSGAHLLELIEHNRATIITTIIDKFDAASRRRQVRDESHDIFVLVDESHRSQYGISHAKMRTVFPNACYIGFTGTPLLKKEKSTAQKFGGFIHTYSMRKAVEDGAVTPLLYEGRMSELHGDEAQLDRWFERITQGLSEAQKLDLKKKFRREEELAKSDQRLAEIAYDINQHYKHTFKGSGLKGQLAVSSKAMAIRYKRLLDEYGEVKAEVIISAPDSREGNADTDEARVPEVEQFWQAMMARYGNKDAYENQIIAAFKHSDEPELLIVVDKLLTGFDAPRNAVLYIDKRLREHNILQAIARVNRLFDGKSHGLIIDYRGIFGELNDAIDTYAALEQEGFEAEDVDTVLTNVREEIQQLPQRHSDVWAVFKELPNPDDLEALQLHLEPLDRREHFYEVLGRYARTLQLALGNAHFQEHTPEDKIRRYRHDLKFFLNLRTAVKQRFGEAVDYSSFEIQIRNMVNRYIGADEVRQLVAPVDIFAGAQLDAELDGIDGDAAKADTIAARMKKTITERMEEDPDLYKRLSELIDEAIAAHRAKRLSDADLLSRMRGHLDGLRGQTTSDLPAVLYNTQDAKAYYGLVKEPMAHYIIEGQRNDDLAADIAVQLERLVNQHKVRDWTTKRDVQNAMWNDIEDYLFSIKGRYDLTLDHDTIDRIIEDVLAVAKRRELQP